MKVFGPQGGPSVVWSGARPSGLEAGILCTLAYADIFDYPLTPAEAHRYLIGIPASPGQVADALRTGGWLAGQVRQVGEFWVLRGREHLTGLRRARTAVATRLWPEAVRYARIIAALPFVRMVAVTGGLALDNVEPGDDIDYLVVTAPGRLWVCRALFIGVVRRAARRGVKLCPNYFLSERALVLDDRNLFTAHELTQMVPLYVLDVYWRMRMSNSWTARFLPNAAGLPRHPAAEVRPPRWLGTLLEAASRTPPGDWVERWEMGRKLKKFGPPGPERRFDADHCQGHVDGHGRRTLTAFAARLAGLLKGGF